MSVALALALLGSGGLATIVVELIRRSATKGNRENVFIDQLQEERMRLTELVDKGQSREALLWQYAFELQLHINNGNPPPPPPWPAGLISTHKE